MKFCYKVGFIIGFCLFTFQLSATHIAGGYLGYQCLGLNALGEVEYNISLKLYRDCITGNPNAREDSIPISIFESGNRVGVRWIQPISRDTLQDSFNYECIADRPSLCYEEEVYEGIVALDPRFAYTLTFQRCCRNQAINNVINSDEQGASFTIDIPSFNQFRCNSTPEFSSEPPIVFCSDTPINLDLSATDADGDSLAYSLCAPFNYDNRSNPFPLFSSPPPYNPIPYLPPLIATNPIPSTVQLSINNQTGQLSGTPSANGLYVISFCVEEYRNGVLLSNVRRDIQVNALDCSPIVVSSVQQQQSICEGLSITFENLSTAIFPPIDYAWDFGVNGINTDTSSAFRPTYSFPDTGVYLVRLIADPGSNCADTSFQEYKIYPKLDPTFQSLGGLCSDVNDYTFIVGGDYADYASFQWNFGSTASIGQATTDTVRNVNLNGKGPHELELIVSQQHCSDTLRESIVLFDRPVASFDLDPKAGCYPLNVQFQNLSTVDGPVEYLWNFGDGTGSLLENPQHTYTAIGYYSVSLEVRSSQNCADTVFFSRDSIVYISLDSSKNEIKFGLNDLSGCNPFKLQISDSSIYEGRADYFWDFGDGNLSNERNPSHIYTDTGSYTIGLLLITKDKCIDTLVDSTTTPVKVLPVPSSSLSASDQELPKKEAVFKFDASTSIDYTSSRFLVRGQTFLDSITLTYQFQDTGQFIVSHIATNDFGCEDTSTLKVRVFDEFEFIVPNIFTPNGDGINDIFFPRACGVYDYGLTIFNRFGESIFSSDQLLLGWDGRIDDRPAEEGVYFYVITIKDFRGEYLNYKGNLTLLRD